MEHGTAWGRPWAVGPASWTSRSLSGTRLAGAEGTVEQGRFTVLWSRTDDLQMAPAPLNQLSDLGQTMHLTSFSKPRLAHL